MGHFTKTIPKAMIPVNGQPFLRHQLRNLHLNGIARVVICTGYLGEQIESEVKTNTPAGMSVECIPDGEVLLGTGGSLRRLLSRGVLDDIFLFTYGDSYLTVDHRRVADAFDSSRADSLMTVCENKDGHEKGNAVVEGDMVVLYRKGDNDSRMQWIDYGLSVVTSESVHKHLPPNQECDIASMFERLSIAGRLQAYMSTDRYFEIGSVTGLAELEQHLPGTNNRS